MFRGERLMHQRENEFIQFEGTKKGRGGPKITL